MNDIDWDNLAEELEDTPRARLSQSLAMADEMVAVLIVCELKTGEHLAAAYEYRAGLQPGAGAASLLGLAVWVKAQLLDGMGA